MRVFALIPVKLSYRVVPATGPLQTGRVRRVKKNGKTVRMIAGPSHFGSCGRGAPVETVCNEKKEIFFVQRRPKVVKRSTHLACGCEVVEYHCGGAMVRPTAVLYELPPGTTYGGTVTVEYDIEDALVSYAGKADGSPCPPPPPPPP